jgi:ABC-type Fe3+ transport system permease subunit
VNKEIQINSNVAIVLALIIINVIFLIYLGYDWYLGYQLDPTTQNTEEASTAFKGTAFVLSLLLITLYKVYRNEKIKKFRQNNTNSSNRTENSPVNTVANILLIAIGSFLGICILIALFYTLLFMYGTP